VPEPNTNADSVDVVVETVIRRPLEVVAAYASDPANTPTSLVMRTAEGPFPMETSYSYESTAEGHTRVTLRNRGTPRGFSRLLTPFMRLAMRRANIKDLKALTLRLEG
jgi:hypothetical protein